MRALRVRAALLAGFVAGMLQLAEHSLLGLLMLAFLVQRPDFAGRK